MKLDEKDKIRTKEIRVSILWDTVSTSGIFKNRRWVGFYVVIEGSSIH